MIREIKDSEFDEFVKEGVVLVDLHAAWCGPCRVLGPIVDQLSIEMDAEGKSISMGKLNVDESRDKAVELGVTSIPTILIYKDGEIVERKTGVVQKPKLRELIEKYIS
jgi:thioredoxin 1